MSMCVLLVLTCWTALAAGTVVNWHASHAAFRRLYVLQNEQLAAATAYVAAEADRLDDLDRTLLWISKRSAHELLAKNTYLLNHVNGALLVKRTRSNLLKIKKLLDNEGSMKVIRNLNVGNTVNEDNMLGMYHSIRRLQRTYAIPASEMASGRYRERIIGDPLDTCECYALAEYGFGEGDIYGVIDWSIEAYVKWSADRSACVDVDRLLYYIKAASFYTGLDYESLSKITELRKPINNDNFEQYIDLMANDTYIQDIEAHLNVYETYTNIFHDKKMKTFQRLCVTGKSELPWTTDLKCRYQTKNLFYRILMPFKEEDISVNPYLKLYHDVIFDEEIKYILDLANENPLTDAQYYVNGESILLDEKRLGQLKWLSESTNPELFGKLNYRVECLTEFSTKSAEGYQLVNYGVGGHFSLHVDAFSDGPKYNGNRLITVLFYMTDVPDDGYTVFPNIGYVAHCRRGTAVVWHNLYLNNGTAHKGTFHGGCPVLKGNKWIMTKALYEDQQPLPYDWRTITKFTIA